MCDPKDLPVEEDESVDEPLSEIEEARRRDAELVDINEG